MTVYIVLAIIVVGMGLATWWAIHLQKIEDKHDADRRPH